MRDRFYLYMHGLIFELSTSVQAGSTRYLLDCVVAIVLPTAGRTHPLHPATAPAVKNKR